MRGTNNIFGQDTKQAKLKAGTNIDEDQLLIYETISTTSTINANDVRVKGDKVATEEYVNGKWDTVGNWQAPVISKTATHGIPMPGDRFLIDPSTTEIDWIDYKDCIAEWKPEISNWLYTEPTDGMVVFAKDTDFIWLYNGADWVRLSIQVNHNSMLGLQGGDLLGITGDEMYHLDAPTYLALSGLTDNIQTQLDGKLSNTGTPTITTTGGSFFTFNTTGVRPFFTMKTNNNKPFFIDVSDATGRVGLTVNNNRNMLLDTTNGVAFDGAVTLDSSTTIANRVAIIDGSKRITSASSATTNDLSLLAGIYTDGTTPTIKNQLDAKINNKDAFINSTANTAGQNALRINARGNLTGFPPDFGARHSDTFTINQLLNTKDNMIGSPFLNVTRAGKDGGRWGCGLAMSLNPTPGDSTSESRSELKFELVDGSFNTWRNPLTVRHDAVMLPLETANTVPVLDAYKRLKSSTTTPNDLSLLAGIYVDGDTPTIASQIDAKLDKPTLTANTVAITNASSVLTSSATTGNDLSLLAGVYVDEDSLSVDARLTALEGRVAPLSDLLARLTALEASMLQVTTSRYIRVRVLCPPQTTNPIIEHQDLASSFGIALEGSNYRLKFTLASGFPSNKKFYMTSSPFINYTDSGFPYFMMGEMDVNIAYFYLFNVGGMSVDWQTVNGRFDFVVEVSDVAR